MFAETFKNRNMNLLKELRAQFNLREWIAAFLFYVPTANAKRVKGGARLTQPGEQLTFNERFNYLKNETNR